MPVSDLSVPEWGAPCLCNGTGSSDYDALRVNMSALLLDINDEQIEGAADGFPAAT